MGEAPSDTEVEQGAPLVGTSGKVFNSMMRTANLDRSEFMVTNVFDEKLPDNNIKNWCSPQKEAKEKGFDNLSPIGANGYLRPEYHHHLERLRLELEDARPTVIVPLGATALWAFTGATDITAQRGSVLKASAITPGAKLIPTYHPTFVIHQWKYFTIVVADLIKADKQSHFREIIIPRKELLIEPTDQELNDILPRLLGSDALSVDIETGWGQITNIGFAPDQSFAVNVPFIDLRSPNKSYYDDVHTEVRRWLYVKQVLESNTPKLGQNFGGYDAFWLIDRYGIAPRNFRHDTRLIHHALYPELPKDLEFMGASYTEQGAWKSWGRKSQEKRDS